MRKPADHQKQQYNGGDLQYRGKNTAESIIPRGAGYPAIDGAMLKNEMADMLNISMVCISNDNDVDLIFIS